MKKDEVKEGRLYRTRVSGKFTTVRIDRIVQKTGFTNRTVYEATNLMTGRKLVFRSAQRLLSDVTDNAAHQREMEYQKQRKIEADKMNRLDVALPTKKELCCAWVAGPECCDCTSCKQRTGRSGGGQ